MEGESAFCGESLKDGATASLDCFPTVGQIGAEAAHFLRNCGTGSQAHIGGRLLRTQPQIASSELKFGL